MSRYQHKKGQIRDNAIEALLHDPLFRQRVETSQKGKGSYRRKEKHARAGYQEASGKKYILPLAFSFISQRKTASERAVFKLYTWPLRCFKRSRISVSSVSSAEGVGAAFSTSFFLCNLFSNLIATKIAKATITKSKTD